MVRKIHCSGTAPLTGAFKLTLCSQPAFQAINLEPEENLDEQIDTTKELHVC
mgnify:CR=1